MRLEENDSGVFVHGPVGIVVVCVLEIPRFLDGLADSAKDCPNGSEHTTSRTTTTTTAVATDDTMAARKVEVEEEREY
jgi:hypothetical protein